MPTSENDRTPREQVMDVLTRHEGCVQNLDGDWLCTCGAFLCPPGDNRLTRSHREHLATVLTRVLPPGSTEGPR